MIDLKEVNRQIDWLVKNMPFAPPPWATHALAELIEMKKYLEERKPAADREKNNPLTKSNKGE